MVTPHQIEVIIDYNTMRAPQGLHREYKDGVLHMYCEPHPEIMREWYPISETDTWVDVGNPEVEYGQINTVDLRSACDGRMLHDSDCVEGPNNTARPMYNLLQQNTWNQNKRDYFDSNAVRTRNDRLPYHIDDFHLSQHPQGPTVPPLLIRRPSNLSLDHLFHPGLAEHVAPQWADTGAGVTPNAQRE